MIYNYVGYLLWDFSPFVYLVRFLIHYLFLPSISDILYAHRYVSDIETYCLLLSYLNAILAFRFLFNTLYGGLHLIVLQINQPTFMMYALPFRFL
jgi:hypothetical protein